LAPSPLSPTGQSTRLGRAHRDHPRIRRQSPGPGEKDGGDVLERYETIAAGKSEGLGGDTYYGYESNLLAIVEANFASFDVPIASNNVNLIQGLFEDTIRPDGPVALAHVDGDWYESVRVCLDRIWPAISTGGRIVLDDYYSWSGCRSAFDDWLPAVDDCRVNWALARPHLIKV
jgi:asparagine synthase (glutamine-hydrolysing)